jgi:hypothetical protein
MSMGYDRDPTYERLLEHTSRHNIRKWLLKGTYREDAQTIRHAINRLSDEELARGLAQILASK